MSLTLPPAPPEYDANNEDQTRRRIADEDARNQKIGIAPVLTASDGSRWKVIVGTTGTLSTVAA